MNISLPFLSQMESLSTEAPLYNIKLENKASLLPIHLNPLNNRLHHHWEIFKGLQLENVENSLIWSFYSKTKAIKVLWKWSNTLAKKALVRTKSNEPILEPQSGQKIQAWFN